MKLDTPVKMDHVRFVCIGCTHGSRLDPATIPPGDILLIAGDFTSCGLPKEVQAFNKNLGEFGVTSKKKMERTPDGGHFAKLVVLVLLLFYGLLP